jgi:UDP-N-acetylmuramate--alanine ligase
MTVVFQPHLFSRTRDFLDNFAEILTTADDLLLMEIYPARELPIAGVTSSALAEKIGTNVTVCNHQSAVELIKNKQPELLLTVGAGDIDTLVLPLKELLSNA